MRGRTRAAPGRGASHRSDSRQHVLEVTEALGGGVLTILLEICRRLDPTEFRVTMAYSPRSGAPSHEDLCRAFGSDVRLIRVPGQRDIHPLRDLATLRHYVDLIRQDRPDVLHLHSSKAGFLGRLAGRLTGVRRVFYSPQGLSYLRCDVSEARRRSYRFLEWVAGQFGGTVLCSSASEAEQLRGVVPDDRILVVENAVDIPQIDRIVSTSSTLHGASSEPASYRRPTVIGSVGRLCVQKDPSMFLDVAARLRGLVGQEVKFVWIGDGELREQVERRIRSLKLDPAVRITGWQDREDALRSLCTGVDIYLQTSMWEGMPLALIEAMVLGKPIVARDVVGSRDVVEVGVTGWLGRTVEDLARACHRLLEDGDMRTNMSREARRVAIDRFSSSVFGERMIRIYRRDRAAGGTSARTFLEGERTVD